jgi:hypothetical protein
MIQHGCTCGYQAEDPDDLIAHFGEMFIPDDDKAPDGQAHFEASSNTGKDTTTATLTCRCGFVAPLGEFDQHLLDMFAPADRIGLDGQKHAPVA